MDLEHLLNNPFKKNSEKAAVNIAHKKGPYQNTLEALEKFDLSTVKNKKVLLKPNAGRMSEPGKGVTTDPQVIAASIDKFREYGAEVAIGESPISGVNTEEAFKSTGIAEVAHKRNCPLIDMDKRPYFQVNIPDYIAIDNMKVCPEIAEYDIIISIPVIKTHMHTEVTLSIKNMKGCLWRRSKVYLHMLPPQENYKEKPIDLAISDMASLLKPHFVIIDGTMCMEGLGPSAGDPKPMDMVIASNDAFAADCISCEIMGIKPNDVPHLNLLSKRGFDEIETYNNCKITPENWKNLASSFKTQKNISIEFPNVKVFDKNSCSACQSSLLIFLKRYGDLLKEYFDEEVVNIAIGKGNKNIPEGTLCIGNCMRNEKNCNLFVPGCPPVSSEILCSITGKTEYDTMDGKASIDSNAEKEEKSTDKDKNKDDSS